LRVVPFFTFRAQKKESLTPLPSSEEKSRNTVPLSELSEGERGVVVEVWGPETLRSRLRAIGLREGVELSCVRYSPFGDPIEFSLSHIRIALRREDAFKIRVRKI
jgi:ferrous iron transport protein A